MRLEEIQDIRIDELATVAERLAADRILIALETQGQRADRAFDQIVDRVEGKPMQSHEIAVKEKPTPERLLQEIETELGGRASEAELQSIGEAENPEARKLLE